MKYPLTCPQCKKKFSLFASDWHSIVRQSFVCDKCGYTAPFVSLIPGLSEYRTPGATHTTDPSPRTHIATGAPTDGGLRTRVHTENKETPVAPPRPLPLYFEVAGTGRRLSLYPGEAVLGRDSADSPATVKVAPDPFMSRRAVILTISLLSPKSVKVEITPLKTANPVRVNGRIIPEGRRQALKPGDRLLLGETVVILKIDK